MQLFPIAHSLNGAQSSCAWKNSPTALSLAQGKPVCFVICGPSGAGKTTTGQRLADVLGCRFEEGDEYHDAANVNKMRSGIPLTDEDRWPWLQRLRTEVVERYLVKEGRSVVVACSALKRRYRDILRGKDVEAGPVPVTTGCEMVSRKLEVYFIMLSADAKDLEQRLAQRVNHYMPASLLASQLAALELVDDLHEDGVTVHVNNRFGPDLVLQDILQRLSTFGQAMTANDLS